MTRLRLSLLADKSDATSDSVISDFISVPNLSNEQRHYWLEYSIPEHQAALVPAPVNNNPASSTASLARSTESQAKKHRVRTSSLPKITFTSAFVSTPEMQAIVIPEEPKQTESAG